MSLPRLMLCKSICPSCGQPLKRVEMIDTSWQCHNGHSFPEIQGVPVLRENWQSEPVDPCGGNGILDAQSCLDTNGLIAMVRRTIGTNYVPYPYPLNRLTSPESAILNIGAGMAKRLTTNTVNLDYFLFSHTDVVADAHCIPFESEMFDLVISEFMLEHVADPFQVCREIRRLLRPGGYCYISYPFIHPYHSFPSDYYRFTHMGIRRLFPGFEAEEEGVLTGPACRWIGGTADLVCLVIPGVLPKLVLRTIILGLLFPVRFLDILLNRLPTAVDHAVTLYTVLRKPVM